MLARFILGIVSVGIGVTVLDCALGTEHSVAAVVVGVILADHIQLQIYELSKSSDRRS